MVRAILDGTKTQTRRVVKGAPMQWLVRDKFAPEFVADPGNHLCPYGQPGDRLWVRETFADLRGTGIEHRPDTSGPLKRFAFAADHPPGSHGDEARKEFGVKWKPSIHMPRAASRITLEITGVRVERLQDISEEDALAEGCTSTAIVHEDGEDYTGHYASEEYQDLWESINGPGSWDANPWVWVVEFKRLEQPA